MGPSHRGRREVSGVKVAIEALFTEIRTFDMKIKILYIADKIIFKNTF